MSEWKHYLRSSYTTIDKKSYLRTFQAYYDPIKGKTIKNGVNWKAKGFKSEKQTLRYLKEQIVNEFKKDSMFADMNQCETFRELTVLLAKSLVTNCSSNDCPLPKRDSCTVPMTVFYG